MTADGGECEAVLDQFQAGIELTGSFNHQGSGKDRIAGKVGIDP